MKTIRRTIAVAVLSMPLVIASCKNKNTSDGASGAPKTATATAVPDLTIPVSDPAPIPVAAPTPAGPAAHATIGYQGGSLKSADGRIQISLPPGAVYADTEVSIQPVTTDDLEGIGPTYQLSPEGTQFNTPVTLAFQLSDADLGGRAITEAIIATRDENGAWTRQRGVKYDAAAKVVRVASSHFSAWKATWANNLPTVTITPPQDEISVNKSVELRVTFGQTPPMRSTPGLDSSSPTPPARETGNGALAKASSGVSDDDLLAAPTPKGATDDDLLTAPIACQWKVNGIANGNPTYGYIHPAQGEKKATYAAPAKIPQRNPVAVSCEMKTGHAKLIVVSNITITDKKGWSVGVQYEYLEHHSYTGKTVAGTIATTWGEAHRDVYVQFHVYSDSRYAAGAVGGMGKGSGFTIQKGGMKNSLCHTGDITTLEGPFQAEASGSPSKAGQLTVIVHGDNLQGHSHHEGTCGKNVVPDEDWDTGSVNTTCNFTGVDYEKGGTFPAEVPSDQGHGKCTLTIDPM
jgi:hypothetical protein